MKVTKSQLKQIIKEELGMMSEQEPEEMGSDELKQSYNFEIYDPGHYREDPSTTLMYVENVPLSMLGTEDYEKYKAEGYVNPERFLRIKKEFLSELGFQANKYGNFNVGMNVIDRAPDSIGVNVPFNLRTREFMMDRVNPDRILKVVDAQGITK